jgi:ATP-dependent Clp protease ATP-binding subunit ClpC
MGAAVENHEFEKARFYQEEQFKEKNNLLELERKLGLHDAPSLTVGRAEVEAIIEKWSKYPYTA